MPVTFLSPSVFAFPLLTEAYILTVVLSKKSIMEEIKTFCNDCWGLLKTGFMVVHHQESTNFENNGPESLPATFGKIPMHRLRQLLVHTDWHKKRTRLLMKIAQTEISLAVSCQTLFVTMNASIHLWQENFLCVFVKTISLSKIKQMIWYFVWTAVQVAAQKKSKSSDFSAQFRPYLSIFTNNNIWVENTELDTCLSAAVHMLRNRVPPLSWHSVWLV